MSYSPGCTDLFRRATFYTSGMEHSPTSATGTGWERTPWRAVQVAGWQALRNASAEKEGDDRRRGLVRRRLDRMSRNAHLTKPGRTTC